MKRPVIDTSAIMAILLGEPGQDAAARLLPGGILSAVNLVEVLTKCFERAVPAEMAQTYIRYANIEVVPFDAKQALISADLFAGAKKGVLSLGDRACLATAISLGATVVTADRIWAELDLPCPVELIR